MSWNLVLEHLFIVLAASLLSILVGVSLGIWAYVSSKTRPVILRVVDLLQTIPSLAMLGIIMVFLGAGKITVIIGITLYSLLPIVRNTCLGLQQVDPGVKEAARGMGMSKPYRILMVEFPLAIPTVFTGVRIAVVNAIGTAVFAAFVGGGGPWRHHQSRYPHSGYAPDSYRHRLPDDHCSSGGFPFGVVGAAGSPQPRRFSKNVDPCGWFAGVLSASAALRKDFRR